MDLRPYSDTPFDKTDPLSIYDYSQRLIGHSLRSLLGEEVVAQKRKGKGGLGQMVEELFFKYDINSNPEADFKDANLELKCTPLLKSKFDGSLRLKERLVCTMIDYFDIVNTKFEDSHLILKCRLMLILFYLHIKGSQVYDYKFLFRVLWQLPDKDLLLIKKDYDTIADKVRRGEAHLLSEGDTIYLGACRKGQKGDSPQSQPYSDAKANKRAFSLKPAYMRYLLGHVTASDNGCYTNYARPSSESFELVSSVELANQTFEKIILNRFDRFKGLNYVQICDILGIQPYQAKNKYADIAALIASDRQSKRISKSEEFIKSGIIMKTVRLRNNGMPKEAMSLKNIDYQEVYDNSDWVESEAYELFTNRFLFVIFKPDPNHTITFSNQADGKDVTEDAYILDKVFFWTMPSDDLETAHKYWENIRQNILENNICLDAFWSISDNRSFHVRPKGKNKTQLTTNPHGGYAEKYCYWFNAAFVKQIIDSNS